MAAITMSMAPTFVLTTVEFDVIRSRGGTESSRTTLSLNAPGTSHAGSLCGALWRAARVLGEAGGWQSSSRAFALPGQITVGAPR